MTSPVNTEMEARVSAMEPHELEARRRQIVESAKGDFRALSTEALSELCFITSALRKRNAGPPKVAKTPAAKSKSTAVEDLL